MEKIYFNSLKGKRTKYGIRLFGKVNEILTEMAKYEKHGGWIDLELKERREPDKNNCTHYLIVNVYETNEGVDFSQKKHTQKGQSIKSLIKQKM